MDFNAHMAYNAATNVAAAKLKRINSQLTDHAHEFFENDLHWGYIGDLGYISDKLDEIIEFLERDSD
jgi:hypothetical protein